MTFQTDAPLQHRSLHASNRSAREAARMAFEGDLDVAPPYQRASVWGDDQRLGLIRSWLSGVPIPAVMLNDRGSDSWERANGPLPIDQPAYVAVDGRQRIETAVAWFFGEFPAPASWFPAEDVEETIETDDGPYVTFSRLTKTAQRFFTNRAMLPVIEANALSVAEEADLYLLVNGSGTPQSDADMENARLHSSEF